MSCTASDYITGAINAIEYARHTRALENDDTQDTVTAEMTQARDILCDCLTKVNHAQDVKSVLNQVRGKTVGELCSMWRTAREWQRTCIPTLREVYQLKVDIALSTLFEKFELMCMCGENEYSSMKTHFTIMLKDSDTGELAPLHFGLSELNGLGMRIIRKAEYDHIVEMLRASTYPKAMVRCMCEHIHLMQSMVDV